ncbi:MAG: hypothetical protein MUE46_09250 [Xanthomonadales bacterium]|jgi:hypothetical protein|nr:hypothetical protein [Xanthomonadales bacterium]
MTHPREDVDVEGEDVGELSPDRQASMNQIVRRLIYFFLGVVPAFVVTAVIAAILPLSIPAAAGTIGLTIASFRRFPLSERSYGRMALLLTCGLIVAIPFGLIVSLLALLDSVEAHAADSAAYMALVLWAFFGPVACAIHALRYGRSAARALTEPN